MCEEIQEIFWRVMLELPKGTPKVMLTSETQSLKMKHRIWREKLLTAKSILQKEGSLANMIYMEQIEMGWPGLAKEVEQICKAIGLANINEKEIDKKDIEKHIFYHNYKELKEDMDRYDKLEDIKNEDMREIQPYMNMKSLEKVRMAFRIRSKMVKNIKLNYKKMFKDHECKQCQGGYQESQSHTMICNGWEEERRGLNLEQIEDTIEFFIRILKEKGRQSREGRT